MPSNPPSSYWDACLFIHYAAADPEWIVTLDAMVKEARDSDRAIATATLSRVEAAFTPQEKEQRTPAKEVDEAISDMLGDSSLIELIEFDREIAEDARQLVRMAMGQGRSLKPADAVHVASARAAGVEVLYSTDKNLLSLCDALDLQSASLPSTRRAQPPDADQQDMFAFQDPD